MDYKNIVSYLLGSVRQVVDMEDGAVMQRLDYDVWGNVTLNTSLYGYVANDCVNFIDPSGLSPTQKNLASLAGIGPFDTYATLLAAKLAVASAEKSGLPDDGRGKQEAYRHCV